MDSDKREKYQAVELKDRGNTEEENGTAVTWKQDITTKDQVGCCRVQCHSAHAKERALHVALISPVCICAARQEGKWKILLADLRKGADLTSMLIPAEFIRPQSVLERLGFLMQVGRTTVTHARIFIFHCMASARPS